MRYKEIGRREQVKNLLQKAHFRGSFFLALCDVAFDLYANACVPVGGGRLGHAKPDQNMTFPARLLRIALVLGAIVDATVAILAIFFQPLLGPLFDVPTKDPALTTIAGGEYVVVTLIYVMLLRDTKRYAPLLWLVALDQLFAALIPAWEISRGHVVATWKTIGPIPINLVLAATYALAARSHATTTKPRLI